MPYSAGGYENRAEECVRLASLTKDDMLSQQLLKLRQTYLRTAEELRRLSGGGRHSEAKS